MDTDVSTYLSEKGLTIFRGSGAEVTTHCIFCPDGDTKGKGKLYINAESWLYECKRCGERGNQKTLLRHFGDEDKAVAFLPGEDPGVRRKVLEEYVSHAETLLANNDEMMSYLLRRGLSATTIMEARYGYVPKNYGICSSLATSWKAADLIASGMMNSSGREYFQDRITIPYLSHGTVLSVRGKDPKGKYFTATGDVVRLYGIDDLREAEDVIITEGEFDRDVLKQELQSCPDPRLRRTAVVGLPGAGVLPTGFDSYFGQAKRIYIGLDPDDTGRRFALKMKETLGARARIVELPDTLPKCDWSEYIGVRGHGWREIGDLLQSAAGRRIFSMSAAGSAWRKQRALTAGIRLGFAELDAVLKPGLQPGQVCIPLAKTGTGKTVFLANVTYYNRNRRVLFVSLEMTAVEVYELLQRIYRFWHPMAGPDQMHEDLKTVFIVDENRLSEKDLEALVEEFTDEVGGPPELMLLDYLGYLARGMKGGDSYEKTGAAVMAVKAMAKQVGAAVIAPHQVNRGAKDGKPLEADDARDSGVIEETGDFVLGLFKPDEAQEVAVAGQPGMVTGNVQASLLKSRHGGKGKVFSLKTSAASLVMVDQSNRKACTKIDQENARINRGEHYSDIYADQSTVQLTLVQPA